MGCIAQLPVNVADNPIHSITILVVSMGCIAQLPVNLWNFRMEPTILRFNGLHCPTPCKQIFSIKDGDVVVSMGCIAQLPVNQEGMRQTGLRCVSMGCIAQLPVNLFSDGSEEILACFNGLHCPTPCKQKNSLSPCS